MKSIVVSAALCLLPALAQAQESPPPPAGQTVESTPETTTATAGPEAKAATAAVADPTAAVGMAQEDGPHLSAGISHSLGTGAFADYRYFSHFTGILSVSPSYSFSAKGIALQASAGVRVAVEYTLPDNSVGRRTRMAGDPSLSLSAPSLWTVPFVGVSVTPSFTLSVPVSLESQHASTITVASLGAALSGRVWKLNLLWIPEVSRGFYGNPAIVASSGANRDQLANLILLCRPGEEFCASAGLNTAWTVSNALAASYSIRAGLTLMVSVSLTNGWNHGATDEVDEFTPQTVDSNGNPVARAGLIQWDRLGGRIAVQYLISPSLAASFSVASLGQPLTDDNRHLRFPFFDFVGPAANRASFTLGLSAFL